MTEIILQKYPVSNGNVRFDLMGKDLPKNFLGLGGDVNFDRHFKEGDYLGMSLSPGMQALANQSRLIVMAKAEPGQGKLVLGLTQKAESLGSVADGLLASFTFKDSSMEAAGFTNKVISIFEGGRKDVQAQWTINNSVSATDVVEVQRPEPVQKVLASESPDQSAETIQLTSQKVANLQEVGKNSDWGVNWIILSVFVVLGLVLAILVFWLRRSAGVALPRLNLRLAEGADFA